MFAFERRARIDVAVTLARDRVLRALCMRSCVRGGVVRANCDRNESGANDARKSKRRDTDTIDPFYHSRASFHNCKLSTGIASPPVNHG